MKFTTLEDFQIFYQNEDELKSLIQEIFIDEEYKTKLNKLDPLIIDCGSHIGLSILYFKKVYPNCRIIAFEPDPQNFEILKQNINVNNLKDIELHQAALAKNEGTITFYRTADPQQSFSWGNTIVNGYQENRSKAVKVSSVKLSNYLNQPVNLLKMDIEGAELGVLQEIEPQLSNVNQIILEYHGLPNAKTNRFTDVLQILKRNFKNVSVLDKKPTPKNWRWEFFKKNGIALFRIKNPYYFIIKATKDQTKSIRDVVN